MAYKVINTTDTIAESGSVESNCLSISFKVKDGTGAVVEIDGFVLADGDPMYSLSNDYPGIDVTRYYAKFTTPGVLYIIRKRVVGSTDENGNPKNC